MTFFPKQNISEFGISLLPGLTGDSHNPTSEYTVDPDQCRG